MLHDIKSDPDLPDKDKFDIFTERGSGADQLPDHNTFEIMGQNGDTKSIWNKNNPDEVDAARRQFDFLVKTKRFAAFYVVGGDGNKGKQMTEFDPNAERVIFVPPIAGG